MHKLLSGGLGWLDSGYFFLRNRIFSKEPALFYEGWGTNSAIDAVAQRFDARGSTADIDVEWEGDWIAGDGYRYRDGKFQSPHYQEHLPLESSVAYFRMVLPIAVVNCPVAVHPATTRENGYEGRKKNAITLAQTGIGSVLMENPFRGRRRPACQPTATLGKLSDFVLLCGAAIEEARSLLQWLYKQGHQRLAVVGISKGGYIASVAGILSPVPVAIVTIVAPHNGIVVFIDGLTSKLCDWKKLTHTCGPCGNISARMKSVFNATSLERLPSPVSDTKVILIGARHDRFVSRASYETMRDHWPNAEIRWLPGGHVSSILQSRYFVSAICDALAADSFPLSDELRDNTV